MKISKLFHWLYAILMFLPFVALAFNFVRIGLSGEMPITSIEDVFGLIWTPGYLVNTVSNTIRGVYSYLFYTMFGVEISTYMSKIISLFTYWTIMSVVYLIFDVIMYVPLLVHRWIDKARLE